MTSTNDEKGVKSNQISGPKGKTYYIEIYKSLEAALTSASPLSERTEALCAAWSRVYRLCAHSATTTHAHLLAWLQRHTARVILQTEWQSPASAEFRDCLDNALLAFLHESKEAAAARNDIHSWEIQLCQRAAWFRKTLLDPWGHPVLKKLLDQSGPQPAHAEVLEWLKEERGVIFVTRLRQLAASRCNDLALTLTSAVMERVRATDILDDRPTEAVQSKENSYRTLLTEEAGFTCDVWELLVDLEFILLHKMGRTERCIELAKQTPLRCGYQLVERLRTRLETSPREKKLWKNGKDVATIIAQVIVTRCMVSPVCADTARAALYCCARSLVRLLPAARLPAAAAALAAPAATPRHLHTLAAATEAQCKEEMKPFVCELYVRAITAGMNELERLKHDAKKESEARAMEQTLASWFLQLGKLLSGSARIRCECALTAFSMHPSPAMLDKLKDAPPLPVVDKQEPIDEPKSEFGSWANDSHGQSNFVKTSETLKLKHSHKQTNVLSNALLTEGETLGLSAELCQDIAALLSGPRLKTLSWDMDREKLLEVCRSHMERTDCGNRTLTTELRFLNLDPNDWRHLPEEDDGEGDVYYGIERGYEHLVEIPEPEPEEIWADAICESDVTATAGSSGDEDDDSQYRMKKSRSRKSGFTSDENDPLSLTAERKERQPSKERQTEKKDKPRKDRPKVKEEGERSKSKSKKKRETSQERRKEMKAQKKREKKERKKMEHDDVAPKPTTSLSSLIGLKVCSSEEIEPDLKMEKNMQKEKKKKPPIDNQRQSSESDSQVVYDGQFSMDELKSPPHPVFQGDILAKYRSEMTPDTSTLSPVLPVPSPVPRVESPVREDVRERITKLLAFRRQKNCYSTPLNSPLQSFTPEKLCTPKAQDFSHSSLGSPLDRPTESATLPYESVIKTVPSITSTVTSTVTSTSMSTPLVSPYLSKQSDTLALNKSAQFHPDSISSNVMATNAYNIPATVTSQSQFGGPLMPSQQMQLSKDKQRMQANAKKSPVKRQPKAKSILPPNYIHTGQKVEDWQSLLDQHLTKAQPAQETEKAPRKIYGMKDFISLLQAEYTKIGKDPTVLNNLPKQPYVEDKSASRRISGMQDFQSAIQSEYAKIEQNPSVADLSKRPLDDEESSAKFIQRKQLEDAPKTFSRRAYYKTTKQKEASKQTSEREAISNELERHISEFQKLKQLQSNGTITIGKIDAAKANHAVNTISQSNPVLVSFLNAPSPIKNSQAVPEVPRSNVPLTSMHMDQKEIDSLRQQQNNLVRRSYAPIGPTIAPTLQFNNELKASANKVPNSTVTNASYSARSVHYNSTLEKAPTAIGSTGVSPNIVRNLQFNNTANKVPNAAITGQTSHMPNIVHTLQFNNTVNKVTNSTINTAPIRATPNTAHTSQIEYEPKVAANKIVTAAANEKDNNDKKGFQNEFHKMIGQSVLISNNKAYLEYDQEPMGVTQPHPAVLRKATGKKGDQESKSQTKTKTAINKPKDKIQNDLVSVMDALRAHKTPSRGPNALAMALQRNEMMKEQTMEQKPRKINDKVVNNEVMKHDSKQNVAPPKPTKVPENKIGKPTNTFDINQLIENEVAYQINAKNFKIPDPNKLIETVKSMLKKPDILTLTKKSGEQASPFGTSSAQTGVKKVEARKANVPKPQMQATAAQQTVSMPALVDARAPVVIKNEVIPNITGTVIQKVPNQKVAQEIPAKHLTIKIGPDSVPTLVEVEKGPISLSNKQRDLTTKSANSQKGSKAPVQKRTHKCPIPAVQEEYQLLDELMDKELLEEIDELSSDEDTQKSELAKNKVQLPKTDVIANRTTPIESNKGKAPSAEVLPFNADKTQSYVGMRVVREFETSTNAMPSEAYNIAKASINNKVNSPIPAASTSAVTVPISNIVLLTPNIVAYPTPNTVFQGPVTSIIVNPTPNLAVYQTTQYAVPTVNQIIIGNAASVHNNNTVNNVASEVANTVLNVKRTDETPQFSKADVPKHVRGVGKTDAKPKNKIEILEQKTLNFDYTTRNKERKVLHEVQEKQNSPVSDITIKKAEKTTLDKVQTVTTAKNEKMARKDSESVKLKRQAILNRDINQRCFYPPIPLYYEPLNAAPVIAKPNSIQERSPSDCTSGVSNIDHGNVGISKEVAKENAVNDGSCRRILLRSSNKAKAPETPVIPETKRKAVRKPKSKSAPEEGVTVNKNATPKRVSKRNLTKKSLLKKLDDKTVLPDAKVESIEKNEPVDIEEQLVAAEIPKDILGAKKSPVISKLEEQANQSDPTMEETNKFEAFNNQKMVAVSGDTVMKVSDLEPSNVIDADISNAMKVEDNISDSSSKNTVSEEIVSNAEQSKVMRKADDVANALNVIDSKNVKNSARVSDGSAPKETISNAKRSTLVNRDSDIQDIKQVRDVDVNIQQKQKTDDRANLTIDSKKKEFDTNAVKNSKGDENSEDHIPQPRKIKQNLDKKPSCAIKIDDNEPLLNYMNNVKIQSVKMIPTKPGEPSVKCIKITLPNQKTFKVTISGANDVDISTLFENPAVQNIIMSNWTRDKRYKLNIRHNPLNKEPFEVLKTTEVFSLNLKDTGNVIDLVSDEENNQNDSKNLKTEFGIYRIATESIDLDKLQKDMDQKCTVKLLKHPESFFLSQTIKATQITDSETGAVSLENRPNLEKCVEVAAETILELSKQTSQVVDKIGATEVRTVTDEPQPETPIMTVTETVQNESTDIPVLDMVVDFDEQPEPKTKENSDGLVRGIKNINNIDKDIVENDRPKKVDDVLKATEMVNCDTVENDTRSGVTETRSDDKSCVKGDEIRNNEQMIITDTAHNNIILDKKELKKDDETDQAEVSLKGESERGAPVSILMNKYLVSENTALNLKEKTLIAIETTPFSVTQDEELLFDGQLPENKEVISEELPISPIQTLVNSTTEELQNEKEHVSGSNVCLEKAADCKILVTDEDRTIDVAEQTLKPHKEQESEIVLDEMVQVQNIDEANITTKVPEDEIVPEDIVIIDDEKSKNKRKPAENTEKPAELIEEAEVDDVVFMGEEVIGLVPVKITQETMKESDNSDDVVFVNEERFDDSLVRKKSYTTDTIDKIIEEISNKIVNEDEVSVKSIIESSIVNEIEDSDDSVLPDIIELDSSSNDELELNEHDVVIPKIIDLPDITKLKSQLIQPDEKINEFKNLLLNDIGVFVNDAPTQKSLTKNKTRKSKSAPELAVTKPCDPKLSQKCLVKLVNCDELVEKYNIQKAIIQKKCFVQLVKCDNMIKTTSDTDTEIEFHLASPKETPNRLGSPSILNNIPWEEDLNIFFEDENVSESTGKTSPVIEIFDLISRCSKNNQDESGKMCPIECTAEWFATKRPANYQQNIISMPSELLKMRPKVLSLLSSALNILDQRLYSPKSPSRKRKLTLLEEIVVMKKSATDRGKDLIDQHSVSREALQTLEELKTLTAIDVVTAKKCDDLMVSITKLHEVELQGEQTERHFDVNEELKATLTSPIVMIEQPEKHNDASNAIPATTFGVLTLPQEIDSCDLKPINVIADLTHRDENAAVEMSVSTDPVIISLKNCEPKAALNDCAADVGKLTPVIVQGEDITVTNTDKNTTDEVLDTTSNVTIDFNKEPNQYEKYVISANNIGSDTSSCEKQENLEDVSINVIDEKVLTTTELENQRQDIESTAATVTIETTFEVKDEPMTSEAFKTILSVERLHTDYTEELEADLTNDEPMITKDLETEHHENIVTEKRDMMDDDTKTSQEELSPSKACECTDQSVESQNNNVIKMLHSPDQTIMPVALDNFKACDNTDISKSGDNIDKSQTSSQQNNADSEESKMQDNIIEIPLASYDLPLQSAIGNVVQSRLDQQTECAKTECLAVVPNAPDPTVVPIITSCTTTPNCTSVSSTEKCEVSDDADGETLASNDKLLRSEAIDSKLHQSIECSNSEEFEVQIYDVNTSAFSTTKVESVQKLSELENIRDTEEVKLPFNAEQEKIPEPTPSMPIVKPDKDIKNDRDEEKTSVFVESIAYLVTEMHDKKVIDLTKEVTVSAKKETKDMIALHVEAFNNSNQESDLSCSEKTEDAKETIVVGYEDVQEEVILDFDDNSNYEPTSPDSNSSTAQMHSSDNTLETNAQEIAPRKSDFVELLKNSLGCETSREIVDIIENTKVVLEESEDTESVKDNEIQYVNSPPTPSIIRESSTPIEYAEQPGLILKGIEIKDPIVGTCYVFRPIDDSLSDTASSKTDLNESDSLNESTEEVYEILKITDDEEINSPDEYANPETPVTLQEDKIDCAFPVPNEREDSNDSDLCVKKPKRTYSPIYKQRSLKRKLSMTDIQKQQEKKYRKGKRIDCPKLSASSMKEFAFGSEYKTLIDYIDSVDFSYSRPFHKDEVNVGDAFSNWPITGPLVKMEDDSNSKPCTDTFLFKEVPDAVREETDKDPLKKSLVDDLSMDCLDTEIKIEITPNEASETNFNMGFGEESGRVIQNLEEGGDISKFSAATLSDVKHTQPVLQSKSEDGKNNADLRESEHDQRYKLIRSINYIQLREKVRSFFAKIKLDLVDDSMPKDGLRDPIKSVDARRVFQNVPGLYDTEFLKPTALFPTVNVVQVGQLPVSAAAQNPVTIDPRVTQVSDASPSQCSVENSPRSDNSQATIKAEYTELTNADLSLPLVQDISEQNQSATVNDNDAITPEQTVIPKEVEIRNEFKERLDLSNENSTPESKQQEPIDFQYENNTNESTTNVPNDLPSNLMFNASSQQVEKSFEPMLKHENGAVEKTDQIAHAMNAAGITTTPETPVSRPHPLVNLISQKVLRTGQSNAGQTSTNNYQKTSINAMALQQALAQILPPPLNQTSGSDGGQHTQNTSHTPQVLHIVQGKNASGNQITLVDNSQQSVISTPNATQVLHIVQNKSAAGTTSNGTPNTQNFSGLSLVDAGLQQGGNQLLHIVNTGNQKNPNATGQLLKRVNLLTNLTNVQGGNEQKMVQFVCKSADGKSIHLNAPHQRSMVLRLQPIETPNVQANVQKPTENQELSPTQISNQSKEAANQQEIKSRSIYEENYAKFIQNSSTPKTSPLEKSTSLPKFNQAFGKATFQEGTGKQNEINTTSHLPQENAECPPSENAINLDHLNQINSPPLLVRKAAPPTSQAQQNLVQQIKQSIAPMNMTMHGGVIYTRQIPVNIGGGQTINLITVPTTELIDENGQKQQSEIETPIIKIVPQTQPNSEGTTDDNAHLGSSSESQQAPQPQQVLTQMRIKLPMLSKSPQVVQGARAVRPAFFQIQRNMIGGANQGQVYQQLVLTAAPPLGQQTIRLPQAAARQVKVQPETPSPSESQLSSSTLEQLREFDMVLEQVKERSTVQPSGSSNGNAAFSKLHTPSTDTTDSNTSVTTSSTSTEHTQQVLYSIGNTSTMNVAYVNRKSTVTTPTTSTFVRSPDSSGIVDSPSSSTSQITQTVTETTTSTTSTSSEATSSTNQPKAAKVGSKSVKSRPKPATATPSALSKVNNPIPPKTSTQKPLEDEQTTQRILYILAEYKEQVENSPDKDKPAPRRRSNPPSNPGSSKRKKSSSGSRRHGCTRDHSPIGDDNCRTMGSEDSSCGTSQGDCTESCSIDAHSPQDSPRKVVRKLTFEQETPLLTQPRIQPPRNVIVADGQTITVARSATGKPTTAVLMPANYILPVSMMKGGQQIAIVTNRGPKLLTVGGPPGEAGAANALILQRLIGPAGLKPVLARPGVRHVRLPATALHNLQAFNIQTTIATAQPPDSTASPAPAPAPPELVETRANSSPWAEREPTTSDVKPERGATPEASEPWHLQPPTDTPDYTYEEPVTSRADNVDRTVLDPIPDRYSPDMEAQRIFDKMFEVDAKKSYIVDGHDSPRHGYDIDASASDCEEPYRQVVQKKDGSTHGLHRVAHISSAAALRHKYAILEHELRLQKSLSEECEDLGVDSPSASELFPEAELLFAASPAHDHSHHASQQSLNQSSIPQPDIDDQIATDHLLPATRTDAADDQPELTDDVNLGLGDGIVTVSEDGTATIALDQEEFARAHPNTTFHSEPTDVGEEVQPFSITSGITKGRHITSTIFHSNTATVLMTAPPQTVISQAPETSHAQPNPVKYADIDNMINSLPSSHTNELNLSSVLVKDDGLTRFDSILTDSRELHLSNTASAIVHPNVTQVIRRVCYDDETKRERERYLMDENDGVIAGDDAKMSVAEESSRDATMDSIGHDDENSSPERHAELFWESNSASERSEGRRPLDFSSDSDKCCKSPSLDETNSTDSSGVGTHLRLDSVIKEARARERSGSADNSSADDTVHPPIRTYPPKRTFHNEGEAERSLSGKTRAGERSSPDSPEVRRRASNRGVVKRGCHCCNGSPVPPRPKKPRQRKPTLDFTNSN